jgi:DNA-binding MarR family transcriptional regulator
MSADLTPDAFRVWFRLLRLETSIRGAMADRLREVGLSVPQCDVLTTLTEQEGVSQQDLAERLYVTKGNISGLVDRLAAAGLVERRTLPNDRRSHAIFLTPEGRSAAEAGISLQRAFVDATLGQLTADDLRAFETQLLKARDLVRSAKGAAKGKAAPGGAQTSARKRSTRPGKAPISSMT